MMLRPGIRESEVTPDNERRQLSSIYAHLQARPRQRYDFSVIGAINTLHGEATGSCESGLCLETLRMLVDWLRWRVDEAWSMPVGDAQRLVFDEAVRALARAALAECDVSWLRRPA